MIRTLFMLAMLYIPVILSAVPDANRVRIVVETLDELAGDITGCERPDIRGYMESGPH